MPTITDNYFPGVHVAERPFQPGATSTAPVVAFGAFIGKASQGPTTPTEVRSWPQFTTHFGTNYTDLHNSVYDFFANGGRRAFIVRIPGAGGAVASLPVYDATVATDPPGGGVTPLFTATSTNPGTWGNTLRVVFYARDVPNFRFDMALFKLPTATTTFDPAKRNSEYLVEQWNDVCLMPNDERYLYSIVNPPSATSSPYIRLSGTSYDLNADPATWKMPVKADGTVSIATKTALASGTDGNYSGAYNDATAYAAAVASLQSIPGPYVLNMPNQTTAAIVTAAIQDAAIRGDVFVICDCPIGSSAAAMATYATSLGLGGFGNISGSFAALYYPQVHMPAIGSPVPGRTALRPAGGAISGAYMSADDSLGPWRVPAGREYRVGGALAAETDLTDADLTSLNNNHVNVLRVVAGTGVSIMGARTLKMSGADMYINVRRTIMEITRNLKETTGLALFENNDERLWARLQGSCDIYLSTVFGRGGLKGGAPNEAYYIRCDNTNNTPNSIAQGVVNIEVGIALMVPAEFIVITIGQYEGGSSSVTVEV